LAVGTVLEDHQLVIGSYIWCLKITNSHWQLHLVLEDHQSIIGSWHFVLEDHQSIIGSAIWCLKITKKSLTVAFGA
jgi:predicted metal-binding transcription factor (methanogenesis marker protein 9)